MKLPFNITYLMYPQCGNSIECMVVLLANTAIACFNQNQFTQKLKSINDGALLDKNQ